MKCIEMSHQRSSTIMICFVRGLRKGCLPKAGEVETRRTPVLYLVLFFWVLNSISWIHFGVCQCHLEKTLNTLRSLLGEFKVVAPSCGKLIAVDLYFR